MKKPSLLTRSLGNPVVVLWMCGWLVHAFANCYRGLGTVPQTIVAGCFAVLSLGAWRKMRVHQAWLRQWNDTGQAETDASARNSADDQKPRRRSRLMFVVPVLGLMLLSMAANNARPEVLPLLRHLFLGCLAWLAVAVMARLIGVP